MITAAKIIPPRLVVQLAGTPNKFATRRPPSNQTKPPTKIKMINKTFMDRNTHCTAYPTFYRKPPGSRKSYHRATVEGNVCVDNLQHRRNFCQKKDKTKSGQSGVKYLLRLYCFAGCGIVREIRRQGRTALLAVFLVNAYQFGLIAFVASVVTWPPLSAAMATGGAIKCDAWGDPVASSSRLNQKALSTPWFGKENWTHRA